MTERTAGEQTAVDSKADRKANLAGKSCITLFVVFVIVLFAFGKAPWVKVTGTDGSRVNFDLISCLGVAMGIFALFFLVANSRRIMRLSTAKKVLGLIGGVGLIAHALFAIFLPLSYGASSATSVGTAGHKPLAHSGPEEWVIDGKTYRIASTYYLRLREGLQYTIEYPYQFRQPEWQMNDERALGIVFPLMKHAYVKGLYKRESITKIGQGAIEPSRIGVTLFEKQGDEVQGYRVGLSLDQIKKRIEQASPPTPSTASTKS